MQRDRRQVGDVVAHDNGTDNKNDEENEHEKVQDRVADDASLPQARLLDRVDGWSDLTAEKWLANDSQGAI